MSFPQDSDQLIWKAFKAGSPDALAILFRKYYAGLLRYGTKITQDEAIAEDNLQTFFLYLFEHRDGINIPQNSQAYIFRSFRRSLLQKIRRRQKERTQLTTFQHHQIIDIQFAPSEIPADEDDGGRKSKLILGLVNALPRRQREAIYLRYYEGLNVKEVAEVLGITYQGTVNTLYKGIKALRKEDSLGELASR